MPSWAWGVAYRLPRPPLFKHFQKFSGPRISRCDSPRALAAHVSGPSWAWSVAHQAPRQPLFENVQKISRPRIFRCDSTRTLAAHVSVPSWAWGVAHRPPRPALFKNSKTFRGREFLRATPPGPSLRTHPGPMGALSVAGRLPRWKVCSRSRARAIFGASPVSVQIGGGGRAPAVAAVILHVVLAALHVVLAALHVVLAGPTCCSRGAFSRMEFWVYMLFSRALHVVLAAAPVVLSALHVVLAPWRGQPRVSLLGPHPRGPPWHSPLPVCGQGPRGPRALRIGPRGHRSPKKIGTENFLGPFLQDPCCTRTRAPLGLERCETAPKSTALPTCSNKFGAENF